MKRLNDSYFSCVRLLTLFTLVFLAGCSYISRHFEETCNFRAYLRTPFADYVSKRYPLGAPIRVGVIPFSVPANVAAHSNELPGLGNQLAWMVKDELLARGTMPIVEVLNRQDWPGKKEYQNVSTK